jgi:hypothetical protein
VHGFAFLSRGEGTQTHELEDKIMKAEEARKFADDALNQLSDALAAGKSESLTQFLAAVAKFHRYSFNNIMLILGQRPDASQVAGFQTWKSLGRFVKKGEKGITIIAPMLLKNREAEATGEGDKPVLRFRAVHVFDVAQTDGQDLPEVGHVCGDPGMHLAKLQQVVASHGIKLITEELVGALGVSIGGTIKLAPGLTPAEEFSVLAHEFAHELLHQGPDGVRGTKTLRETEAEAVAFVVTTAIGLKNASASLDYIQLHDGDAKTLGQSLDRIQKTACLILTALLNSEALAEVQEAA